MLRTIVGKRGKGKTSLAKTLIRSENYDQIFIFDFKREYHFLMRKNLYIFYEDLYNFCRLVWEKSDEQLRTLAILEEVHVYEDYYGVKKVNRWLGYLYRLGRTWNIDVIAISNRFYDLPVIVRALTDDYYLFQTTEERDLNYIRHLASKDLISKLITLEIGQYITLHL